MLNFVTNFRTKNNTFQVGFSHSRILRTVVQHACSRFPSLVPCNNAWTALSRKLQPSKQLEAIHKGTSRQKVFVIFGGDTSERQVSLMSGTNVWLNLQGFDDVRSLAFKYLTLHILCVSILISWFFRIVFIKFLAMFVIIFKLYAIPYHALSLIWYDTMFVAYVAMFYFHASIF
jgi:hypothetical protein